MIEILKASAGSGKTFNLARKYMAQLFVENAALPREQWTPNADLTAYRHVLAVTFTNKATEEMKSRILDELFLLATEPEKSSHYGYFLEHPFNGDGNALKETARKVLQAILHDYGAFAVSTIDRFFQLTLKSFSKEIGHFASYQVELDKPSLIAESVDRVLDSLTSDESSGKLLDWLTDNALNQIQNGGRYSLDAALLNIATRQMTEEHRFKMEKYSLDEDGLCSDGKIKMLKDACAPVIKQYHADLQKAVADVRGCFSAAGIDPADTTRSFMESVIEKIEAVRAGDEVPSLPAALWSDSDQWFPKKNAHLAGLVDEPLLDSVRALRDLLGDRLNEYHTAVILRGQIYGLGVAACLRDSYNRLVKEKNVLDLDNCNTLLKGIIDGTDAPFIYEKMGVRYEHFLLDEFQDTSRVQWDNFLPLLVNSISQGFYNLVVGDVKQSIYRWRNSDWNMLDSELEQKFAGKCGKADLDVNFRSLGNIVGFNNDFFRFAAASLDRQSGTTDVTRIYSGVNQKVKKGKEGQGSVELCFCNEAGEEPRKVLEAIIAAKENGFNPGDIGVLVRTNSDGATIANYLIDNGVDVVTDDSLRVSSSGTVRRIVALLSYIDNPDDKMAGYLFRELDVIPPTSSLSLLDLCESIARSLRDSDPETFDCETAYVSAFMDIVREFSEKNSGGLHAFLQAWKDNSASISSPSLSDAVRVVTVHKAKGLAYPFVIVPYLESIGIYKADKVWCRPRLDGTALEGDCDGLYDVCLSSKSEHTLFIDDYHDELRMQAVDNINVAYVALTRARERMLLIGQKPKDSKIARMKAGQYINFGEILYAYAGFKDSLLVGQHVNHCSEDGRQATTLSSGYPSWPLGERLSLRVDAKDFFSQDGLVGVSASRRLRGIVLHDILSRITVPSDLGDAIAEAVLAGDLSKEEAGEAEALLSSALRSGAARGWFPDDPARVLNEADIIDSNGEILRPDRVVLSPDGGVTVIDYKFGAPMEKYVSQVRRYAGLFARMGRRIEGACLWYVEKDEVVDCLNVN